MAAVSLDVNFKEELSAIEQCGYSFPLILILVLILILIISPFPQGSMFSPKLSAQPP
jgi:hypothetical protein